MVGSTMAAPTCTTEGQKCLSTLKSNIVGVTSKAHICSLWHTFVSCLERACPGQNVQSTANSQLASMGVDCALVTMVGSTMAAPTCTTEGQKCLSTLKSNIVGVTSKAHICSNFTRIAALVTMVGSTMAAPTCTTEGQKCLSTLKSNIVGVTSKAHICSLWHTFVSCLERACPGQNVRSTANSQLASMGVDCGSGSSSIHLVPSQMMPVLLIFILSFFFGVF
ncbi:hypothetical protein ACOMHN_022119 [Nucella lapillus]